MSLSSPRRLDLRLIIGVVIVIATALAGFALISAADNTTSVYTAAKSLSPGHVIKDSDLVLTDVKLG